MSSVEAGETFVCGNDEYPAEEEALSGEAYSVELQFWFYSLTK